MEGNKTYEAMTKILGKNEEENNSGMIEKELRKKLKDNINRP